LPETVCEVRFREYLKWAETIDTRFLTNTVPTRVPMEYWVNYYLRRYKSPEISGFDPIFFLWEPPTGWSKIWRFHSEDEMYDFGNYSVQNAVLKENNYIYLEGPKNDTASIERLVEGGHRVLKLAINMRSLPRLNNLGTDSCLTIVLYNSETFDYVSLDLRFRTGWNVKEHHIYLSYPSVSGILGYFDHPDDYITLVLTCDYENNLLWVEVFHGAFTLLINKWWLSETTPDYDSYYIHLWGDYIPDQQNFVWIDWVAIQYELTGSKVSAKPSPKILEIIKGVR